MRFPEFSGEWERCKVKDFTKVVAGATPSTSNKEYWGGDIRWMNSGELNLKRVYEVQGRITQLGYEKTSTKIIPPQSVLIGLAGQGKTRGTAAINYVELCTNQSIASILPSDKYYPEFLYQNIESRYKELRDISSGDGGRGGLNLQMIYNLNIPYCSIGEQRKIGDFLCLLDQRIETQRKIIEDLKKLKDAINNSLHNNINEFQLFSFNELGNDYLGLTGKSSDDFGSGLPYISYLNVFRNDIVTDGPFDCVKVSKTEKQNVVSYGDLLFTLSSETHSEVGIGAIYLGKTNPIYLNSFCFGVHLSNHENIYGPYLAYFVTSQYFRRTILPFAQGSTRYNLMKGDFMKHKFRFPAMAMQKEMYNALYTLSEKIRNEETCLNKYAKLKQYLLTQMFI